MEKYKQRNIPYEKSLLSSIETKNKKLQEEIIKKMENGEIVRLM
jgi:hypothetical protein